MRLKKKGRQFAHAMPSRTLVCSLNHSASVGQTQTGNSLRAFHDEESEVCSDALRELYVCIASITQIQFAFQFIYQLKLIIFCL